MIICKFPCPADSKPLRCCRMCYIIDRKFICETYGVADAKVWVKEQVRLMNEAAEEEDATRDFITTQPVKKRKGHLKK